MEQLTIQAQHFLLEERLPGGWGVFSGPTCRDLEINYRRILTGTMSAWEKALLMLDTRFGGHQPSRFYQGRVSGLEEWTGKPSPETIVGLVKNPQSTPLCELIIGSQNAVFETEGILFAAMVTSYGFHVRRPVVALYQEELIEAFRRELSDRVKQPLPDVSILVPLLK